MLCRQYLGWKRDNPNLIRGVEYLNLNPISYSKDEKDVYYWYYATQAAHHMEGEHWKKWNKVMRQIVPENQVLKGPEIGSWDPKDDNWADAGGRLFTTCLSTYMLEVYYRHLPIYLKLDP